MLTPYALLQDLPLLSSHFGKKSFQLYTCTPLQNHACSPKVYLFVALRQSKYALPYGLCRSVSSYALCSRNKHHSTPAFGRFYFSVSMLHNRQTLTLQTQFFISYCVPSLMIWPRRERKPLKTFLNLIGIRPFFTDIPHVLHHGKTPSKLRSKGVFSRVIQSLCGFIQCLNFH